MSSRYQGISLVLLMLTVAACGGNAPADGTAAAFPPTDVQTVTLEPKPVPRFSEFVATVRSLRSTTVQPQVEGFVRQIWPFTLPCQLNLRKRAPLAPMTHILGTC